MRQHGSSFVALLLVVCVGSCMAQTASISMWEQCGGTSCPKGECRDAEWGESK
jgi:hypothetical protein